MLNNGFVLNTCFSFSVITVTAIREASHGLDTNVLPTNYYMENYVKRKKDTFKDNAKEDVQFWKCCPALPKYSIVCRWKSSFHLTKCEKRERSMWSESTKRRSEHLQQLVACSFSVNFIQGAPVSSHLSNPTKTLSYSQIYRIVVLIT